MRRPEIIDAEFEVIEQGRPLPVNTQAVSYAVALVLTRFVVGAVALVFSAFAFKHLQQALLRLFS